MSTLSSFHCRLKAKLCLSLDQNKLWAAPLQPWDKVGSFSIICPYILPFKVWPSDPTVAFIFQRVQLHFHFFIRLAAFKLVTQKQMQLKQANNQSLFLSCSVKLVQFFSWRKIRMLSEKSTEKYYHFLPSPPPDSPPRQYFASVTTLTKIQLLLLSKASP